MRNFDYYLPKEAKEAAALLSEVKGARAKSGGTDLLGLMKDGIDRPPAIVNLPKGTLTGIRLEEGLWRLGATTTLAAVAEHQDLAKDAPAITDAAQLTATPLLRNIGTIGGNLCQRPRCWYFRHPEYPCSKKGGDTCFSREGENKYHAIFDNTTCNIVHPSNLAPALWVHDAVLRVVSKDKETDVPISDFWVTPEENIAAETILEPNELITAISFKPLSKRSGSAYVEVREKQSYDWALTSCAVRIDLDGDTVKDVRIVASAVAPTPLRREEAEAVLKGKRFSEELAKQAGEAAASGATPLRDNGYKVRLLKACVKNALLEARERAGK